MENTAVKSPVLIYTEQTPNPESLKFVTNRMLYKGTADFSDRELATNWSPLATELFEFPFVDGVYISNNFVTVTKEPSHNWKDIMLQLKNFIKNFLEEDKDVIKDGFDAAMAKMKAEKSAGQHTGKDAEIAQKVREMLDTYVRPAVEMDGGNIEFKRYEAGKVYVIMQGSCSGCPSASMTLKAGIEGMLKRMIPEVEEVIQEMG